MCTRTLYVGDDGFVVTGRNMDWKEDMSSNLWVFPAGCARTGLAGANSLRWTSKYGSVAVSGYEAGTPDGLNEKGLAANALFLVESDYGTPRDDRPSLSIALWAQYVLDLFATVAEAVEALRADPFNILAPVLPNGAPAALHLALSDASGDSAIFEYIGGALSIHHGRAYRVMTNSPTYDQQLALDAYWKQVGGLVFLPGTNRAADRFARASFLLDSLPRKADPHYLRGIPGQSYEHQALAAVLSLQRAVSVPLGISTPDQPNISSTIWRTIIDHRSRRYCFDSATRPNTFWVDLAKLDFTPGTPIRKLVLQNGEVYAGEVSGSFVPAEDLKWLVAG
ncbi:MAG: hydrolase [Rhizobiales bacterium 32-66-11]|nr:MAG: hydrolase [Rhizobiales bacterium 32-66-11]